MNLTPVKFTAIVLTAFALTGCAVQKELQSIGGSRADGVVELAVDAGPFESVEVDEGQGLQEARRTCSNWGYNDAERFSSGVQSCINAECTWKRLTWKYQCID